MIEIEVAISVLLRKRRIDMLKINEFAKEVHKNAIAHGWHDKERSFGELIALCHSELSEALEEYRKGLKPNYTYYSGGIQVYDSAEDERTGFGNYHMEHQKPEGIPSELADVIIRIFDMCGKYGIDMESMLIKKHDFNKTRPYKHGGKVI